MKATSEIISSQDFSELEISYPCLMQSKLHEGMVVLYQSNENISVVSAGGPFRLGETLVGCDIRDYEPLPPGKEIRLCNK